MPTDNILETTELDIPEIENVEVVNGELHFTDPDTYLDDVDKIMSLNETKLDAWETSIGFRSLRSWINEANEEFGKLTSIDQIPSWQEKYKDVVIIRDSTVTPLVSLVFYQTIANRTGEYMMGDTYAKVSPGKLVMILDGNRSKLQQAMSMEISDDNIVITKFQTNSKINLRYDDCGTSGTETGHKVEGKRSVTLQMTAFTHTYGSSPAMKETKVEIHAFGQKKVLGIWWNYKTLIAGDQINFRVINNNGVLETLSSDDSFISLVETKQITYWIGLNDATTSSSYTLTPLFEDAKGRAVTRGTGTKWATICCGLYYSNVCPSSTGTSPF